MALASLDARGSAQPLSGRAKNTEMFKDIYPFDFSKIRVYLYSLDEDSVTVKQRMDSSAWATRLGLVRRRAGMIGANRLDAWRAVVSRCIQRKERMRRAHAASTNRSTNSP